RRPELGGAAAPRGRDASLRDGVCLTSALRGHRIGLLEVHLPQAVQVRATHEDLRGDPRGTLPSPALPPPPTLSPGWGRGSPRRRSAPEASIMGGVSCPRSSREKGNAGRR